MLGHIDVHELVASLKYGAVPEQLAMQVVPFNTGANAGQVDTHEFPYVYGAVLGQFDRHVLPSALKYGRSNVEHAFTHVFPLK